MNCINAIRDHVTQSPNDRIFSSREFLEFGKRGTVDHALCKLVKTKFLYRLSNGMFIKYDAPIPEPNIVAAAKAAAYGKLLYPSSNCFANEGTKEDKENNSAISFAVTGRTSKFTFGEMQIVLKSTTAKRIHIGESPAGKVAKKLLEVGPNLEPEEISLAVQSLSSEERQHLIQLSRWLPSWLSDKLRSLVIELNQYSEPAPLSDAPQEQQQLEREREDVDVVDEED